MYNNEFGICASLWLEIIQQIKQLVTTVEDTAVHSGYSETFKYQFAYPSHTLATFFNWAVSIPNVFSYCYVLEIF